MKRTSSTIALLVLSAACGKPAEQVHSGIIPPQQPEAPVAAPTDHDGAVPPVIANSGSRPEYVCAHGRTLDPHPDMPQRVCYSWSDFAQQAPPVRGDGGIATLGTRDSFTCPAVDDLAWTSGERCGFIPLCDSVLTEWTLEEDGGAVGGSVAQTQRCCYMVEHWCGV